MSYSVKGDVERLGVGWSPEVENLVKSIGTTTQDNKLQQLRSARKCATTYNTLMYISIVLGPVSAVISGIGVTLHPDAPTLFPVVSSIIAFVAGVFTAIVRFSSLDERSVEHKLAAAQYTRLEGNIRRQLSLPHTLRQSAPLYLQWADKTFDEVFTSSPLLSTSVNRRDEFIVSPHNDLDVVTPRSPLSNRNPASIHQVLRCINEAGSTGDIL
jgi:hypothetical protein